MRRAEVCSEVPGSFLPPICSLKTTPPTLKYEHHMWSTRAGPMCDVENLGTDVSVWNHVECQLFKHDSALDRASQVAQRDRIRLQCRRCRFNPWVGKILWSRKWHPTPVFLPEKFHGQRSLAGLTVHGVARVGHHLATKPPTTTAQTRSFPPLFLWSVFLLISLGFYLPFFIFTSFCLSGLQFSFWKKLWIIFPDLTSHSYSLLPSIIC